MDAMIKRFWQDDDGAELVEWAVVTCVLLSFTVVVIIALRDRIIALYQQIFTAIQNPPPESY
jgi:Flp pilus assembly pilin Flp